MLIIEHFSFILAELDLVRLPLTPVNQRKDVHGSAALTPHLCHIFTCPLCEHQLGAANTAGLKLGANLSQAQILPPFSSVLSPGFGSLL